MNDEKKKENENKKNELSDQSTSEISDLNKDKTLTSKYHDSISANLSEVNVLESSIIAGDTLNTQNRLLGQSQNPEQILKGSVIGNYPEGTFKMQNELLGLSQNPEQILKESVIRNYPEGTFKMQNELLGLSQNPEQILKGSIIGNYPFESELFTKGLSDYAAFEIDRQSDQVFEKNQTLEKEMLELKKQLKAKEKDGVEKDGLMSELIQKVNLKHLFSRLHQDACEKLLNEPEYAAQFQTGTSCNSVVMSIDIRDSTQLMLTAKTPGDYARFITQLCLGLSDLIRSNFGVFDKFTGDGVLAFFPEFYSGPHAIFFALKTAAMAHSLFKNHYKEHRNCFTCIRADVGLGIGIDFGCTTLTTITEDLSVVGTPVVYACRLSIAPPGRTFSNQNAYEKVKELFNLLVEYEDKTIVSMVYNSEYDKVTIDFDKSEDMTKEEDVVETDKKILGNLLNYCKENQIRIAQNNGELFVEIGDDSKGTYHCYEGADLEISENTKITDFE